MPISPASGEILATGIAPMWIQVEERFLDLLRRRIERGIDEQRTDRNIALANKFRAEVDHLLRPGQSEVERILEMAYGRGTAVAGGELEKTGTPFAVAFGIIDLDKIEALAEAAARIVHDTSGHALRSVDDICCSVMTGSAANADRRKIAPRALNCLVSRGFTGFVDTTKRNGDLATCVEMATRTAAGRAVISGHSDRLVQAGHDLVIISDARGECRLCRPFEGKVLSLRGITRGYDTLGSAIAAGLFHLGCRHSTGLFVPG
jgi:hypothetical protein